MEREIMRNWTWSVWAWIVWDFCLVFEREIMRIEMDVECMGLDCLGFWLGF